MFIYVILFLVTMCFSSVEMFSNISRDSKKKLMRMLTLVFIVLSTIRANNAGDYYIYKEVYDYMVNVSSLNQIWNNDNYFYELLYSLIQFLCKYIINSFPFFLLIISIIVGILQYKIVRYWGNKLSENGKKNSYELTSYFILWSLYIGNIFVIRSTLALLVCLYSVKYIEDRKKSKFTFCVLIATMFHTSALIFLPSYLIYHYRGKIRKKLSILAIGIIIGTLFFNKLAIVSIPYIPRFISEKVSIYMTSGIDDGTSFAITIGVMLAKAIINVGFVILLCIMIYQNNNHRDKMTNGYINIYLFGVILYVSTMFQSFAFARIALFYNIFQWPIYLLFFREFGKKKNRNILWFIFWVYMGLRFAMTLYSGRINLIPFTTIFK